MNSDDFQQMAVIGGGVILGFLGIIVLSNFGVTNAVSSVSSRARSALPIG